MSSPTQPPRSLVTLPESPSPNLQRLLALLQAFKEWDIEKIASMFDESLEYHILPASMGKPAMNKQQYMAYFATIMPLFKSSGYHIDIYELIEMGNVISFHGMSITESAAGKPYNNEIMVIMHFAPLSNGDHCLPKITMVKEFVDSIPVVNFFAEEREKAAKRVTA